MTMLHRYWITFADLPELSMWTFGCGVTAYSRDDALEILRFMVFKDEPMLKVQEIVEDVDVNNLDQGHVVPNMGVVAWRGVWFPKGYQGM
jgi:hypothetical protein